MAKRPLFFTDAYLQKLKREPGPFKKTETAAGRGEGRLIAKKAAGGALELYYRQRSSSSAQSISMRCAPRKRKAPTG